MISLKDKSNLSHFFIAIDGRVASGKSVIAANLARHYDIAHLDTGKIYRFLAYLYKNTYSLDDNAFSNSSNEKAPDQQALIERLIHISHNKLSLSQMHKHIEHLDDEHIGALASKFAVFLPVRKALFDMQRNFAFENKYVIMDGRDIGTVILPEAHRKIFLTATPQERANRRYKQLNAILSGQTKHPQQQTIEELQHMIELRDKSDQEREHSPTIAAPDAIIIDSTNLDLQQTISKIISYIEEIL